MSTENQNERQRFQELEEALRKSERLAVAGQFSAAIMHEINNPLETISNLAYLAKAEADNAAKVREYLTQLESELANVIRIAKQTLGFFGPAEALRAVNLVDVAESALLVHGRRLSAKQVNLVKRLVDQATVKIHPGEMLQVLSNLIANAVDALPEKGTLAIRLRKSKNEVHLMIVDDGHGIPPPLIDKVFEPFFTTKKEQGTGLGLALSKAIVERHKGKIRTRSSVSKGRSGTAFRISLPLHEAA
ncbi:sensor histidine kinase [Terriglobus saanensis]|uniref:sensor histidine kinase n=1 Tax=Terriglobus saanensis TaxID=870903 RepID=UPI000304820C|nr:ATP-binding protein [Terriglobus saanensis]